MATTETLQYDITCTDKALLCICDFDGACWTPGTTPPDVAIMNAFCDEKGKRTYCNLEFELLMPGGEILGLEGRYLLVPEEGRDDFLASEAWPCSGTCPELGPPRTPPHPELGPFRTGSLPSVGALLANVSSRAWPSCNPHPPRSAHSRSLSSSEPPARGVPPPPSLYATVLFHIRSLLFQGV